MYPETEKVRDERDEIDEIEGVLVPLQDGTKKAFSLAHFIPLLRERIYVVSPFTRSYLVSWINVLDSVPELELITYLPQFLDGLLQVMVPFPLVPPLIFTLASISRIQQKMSV